MLADLKQPETRHLARNRTPHQTNMAFCRSKIDNKMCIMVFSGQHLKLTELIEGNIVFPNRLVVT